MVRPPMTLSGIITLNIGGGLLVLVLFLGIAVAQGVSRLLDQAFQDKAEALARQLATVTLDAILIYDYGTLERYVRDLQSQPGVLYLRVARADGEVLGEAGRDLDLFQAADHIRVEWPVDLGANRLGAITVAYNTAAVRETVRQISLLGAGGLALVIVLLYFWLRRTLDRRLIQPVQSIAAHIADSGTHSVIEVNDLPEELGRVAQTFSRLCAEIDHNARQREEAERLVRNTLERFCHEQRLVSIGQMAAGLAHGLNTPLGNIIGYTQQAMQATTDRILQQRLGVIEEQARVCAGIVRNLLGAVRAPEAHPRSLSLPQKLNAVVDLIAPVLRDRGVTCIQVEGKVAGPIWADPSCVEQVLFNVLSNAADAGARCLRLRLQESQTQATLRVEDDGAGVPDTVRERMFEPFVTSKPPGEGTGLGLHICKTLLNSVGGDIELVHSQPGDTVFLITWRRVPEGQVG
jgi:signal transduction histidine kinase